MVNNHQARIAKWPCPCSCSFSYVYGTWGQQEQLRMSGNLKDRNLGELSPAVLRAAMHPSHL